MNHYRAIIILAMLIGLVGLHHAEAATGLHVQGNQIIDGSTPLRLLGVNRSGTEYACIQGWGFFDGPSDATSVQAITSWHVNAVRVPLNEDCWLGINAPAAYSGSAYQQAITNYVNLLTQNGLVAILELHWNAPGTQQATGQQQMPDEDHSPAFWQSVASTFKTNPSVIFDLYNEPHDVSWACWRDGGTCSGVSFPVAGMQQLVTTVRNTGASNIIMLGGLAWSNDLSQWLQYEPADPLGNLAASWHSYNFNNCSNLNCWQSHVAPVAQQVPVVAGEIGENDCTHSYIDPLMQWLDNLNQSYLAWTWDTWNCSSGPALITSYSGTPTAYGAGYQAHLAALAASPTPTSTSVPPTATTTPTDIPTSTATATATDTPVPTATPTDTPTAAPTDTPVPTDTSVPPTPTSMPTNTSGTLFSDTFESDAIGSIPSGWAVYGTNAGFTVRQRGSHVYDHNGWTALTVAGNQWTDYTYSAQINPNNWASEADGLAFRVKDSNDYYRIVYQYGTTLSLSKVVRGASITLTSVPLKLTSTWHTMTVTVNGSTIGIAIDGASLLTKNDSTFGSGAIGLVANSPVDFDTVLVTGPTDTPTSIPTATSTDTPTSTATDVPTNTPTATPTNTPVPTPVDTPTDVPTDTPPPTDTPTDTPVPTSTPTVAPTDTPTATPVPTNTPVPTSTPTSTPTDTPVPTSTPINTPVATPVSSIPAIMPLISQQATAYASPNLYSGSSASYANDANSSTQYRSSGTPAWVAYHLSSPVQQALAVYYNSSYAYSTLHGSHYNNLGSYTIDANSSTSTTPPTTGWTPLITVTGNTLHSRQHVLDLTGCNWVRINVTASDGSSLNYDAAFTEFDLYSGRPTDDWIFYGDSITAGGMNTYPNSGVGSFADLIRQAIPGRYPVAENGGEPFDTSSDAVKRILGTGYLSIFPGRYVALSYGMNDAAGSTDGSGFYNNMQKVVQAVLAAGKIPIIPKISYTNDTTHNNNIPILNAKIDQLYQAYPQIVKGPDFWTYFQQHPSLIQAGGIHPTGQGYAAMRQQWANAMLQEVY